MSKAFVQKQAPDFEAEAVLTDGQFGRIKLSAYKGTMYKTPLAKGLSPNKFCLNSSFKGDLLNLS